LSIAYDDSEFLQHYFDKIFVLSLPRFIGRHKRVLQNLQGLPFEFFWGSDKLKLDSKRLQQDGIYDEQKATALQRLGRVMNLGEIACALSHRSIYETMIRKGWKRVLVMEDDVLPCYEVLSSLPDALLELPADWELVYLGYLKHEKVTPRLRVKQLFYKLLSLAGLMKWNYTMVCNLLPKPYSTHLKKAGFHDCTHAYAITLEAAKKLLVEQTPVVYRSDDLLSATNMKGKLKAFVTEPKYFDQEVFHNAAMVSEIKNSGRIIAREYESAG
jgi:glycosyl transferase family 25